MLIEVDNLAGGRAGLQLFDGLSFTLRPGEALRISGPNGTGKSTLLRILAGLTPAMGGAIRMPPETLLYTGHGDGLKSALSTRENLAFWAGLYGDASEHTLSHALERFDLTGLAERRIAELSAGQRRRASLARLALSARPLWFLDEPTTSLDPAQSARFEAILAAHLIAGGGAIIASHLEVAPCTAELDLSDYQARRALPDDPFAMEDVAADEAPGQTRRGTL